MKIETARLHLPFFATRATTAFLTAALFLVTLPSNATLAEQRHSGSQWTQQADMDYGRSEISAAVLNEKVYVAGGIGFFRTLRSCEMYDVANNTWSACPDLPYALHHVAMASNGESVYAAGGYTSLGFTHDPTPLLWRLDEPSKQWIEVTPLPEPIGEHAMQFHDGVLYVIGGRTPEGDSAALRAYNPATKAWRQLPNMPTPRHSFSVVLADNTLWVMGGRSAALGSAIDRIEIYDFETASWRAGPTLPEGGGGHVAVLNNRNIHVIGGEVFEPSSVLDRHDVYNLDSGLWSKRAAPTLPRHGMSGAVVNDNLLLIGGGSRPGLATVFSVTPSVQSIPLAN